MKLLHLYSGNLYGGIERLLGSLPRLHTLYPALQHQFGLCFRGRLFEELTREGAHVLDLGEVRARYPWTVLRARHRLAEHLRRDPPDWVICHTPWPQAIFGGLVRRYRLRMATMFHDAPQRQWMDRWASRHSADLHLANSQHIAARTQPNWPPPAPVVYHCPCELNTPPPPSQRERLREELQTRPEEVVILQAGRFERWKGLHILIDALGLLKDHPNWVAWIAGAPQKPNEQEYLWELHQRAMEWQISARVKFLGWQSQVLSFMHAADVVCQANVTAEPFGLVFVEALSMGRPVVSTALGGALEILTPETAILVEPNQPAAVADALRRLIDDPTLRRRLGDAGPTRARGLVDPERQLRRLHQLLEQHS